MITTAKQCAIGTWFLSQSPFGLTLYRKVNKEEYEMWSNPDNDDAENDKNFIGYRNAG